MSKSDDNDKVQEDDKYWRERLTPEEFEICRRSGTEPAFSGIYFDEKRPGTYLCKCCSEPLFRSEGKYDSGCGWPSFFEPLNGEVVDEQLDTSHGMVRTEITCHRCGCHLGHVFTDGPQPTGLRYCVNSASIHLEADKGE